MKYETKKAYFNEAVSKIKELGYEVYTTSTAEKYFHCYGYFTNGVKILYFEINDLHGLRFSTVCKPSRETGTGCYIEVKAITKETIEAAFSISYGKPYSSFEAFKKREETRWHITLVKL